MLVEITGPSRHFSVTAGYTATRLRLFNSGGLSWLTRRHCLDAINIDTQPDHIDPRSLVVLERR